MVSNAQFRKHRKFLGIVEKIARESNPVAGAKIAALLTVKNQIIALGTNVNKTHPFAAHFCKHPEAKTLHAEHSAIIAARRLLGEEELINSKTTLYICRVKFTGPYTSELVWGLSRPCAGCMEAISSYNVNEVVYSLDHGPNCHNNFETIQFKRGSMKE